MESNPNTKPNSKFSRKTTALFLLLVVGVCVLIIFVSEIPEIQNIISTNQDTNDSFPPLPPSPPSPDITLNYFSTSNGEVSCNETTYLELNDSKEFPSDSVSYECAKVICTFNLNNTLTVKLNHDKITEIRFIVTELNTQNIQSCNCSRVHYLSRHGKINFNVWGYCCIQC